MLRRLFVSSMIVCSVSAPAFAQNPRSAVSSTGNDANLCTVAAPCRSFGVAMAHTNSGGEIIALDSAGYGPFDVDRSVTVMAAPGAYAGITAGGGVGINVNVIGGRVILRNLFLNAAGGSVGVRILAADEVHVESCVVNGFLVSGIYLTDLGRLFVLDTIVRHSSSGLVAEDIVPGFNYPGISLPIVPSLPLRAYVTVDHCRFEQNINYGVFGGASSSIAVRDSVASGNNYGFAVNGATFGAEITLESCLVSINQSFGLHATNGVIRVAETAITANFIGVGSDPTGSVQSFGNNRLAGNATNGTFSAPNIPLQ